MHSGHFLWLLTSNLVAHAGGAPAPATQDLRARDLDILSSRNLESLSHHESGLLNKALLQKNLLDDIWQKLHDTSTCAGGEAFLGALKVLSFFGDKAFVKVVQGICKLAKIQADDVCDGAIALEGPIIASDIRKTSIGSRTSKAICATFLGVCDYPDPQPWHINFPSLKSGSGRPKPSGKEPLKIVHYSDIHIDPLYEPGTSTQCNGRPICCRSYPKDGLAGDIKFPAGPYGDHMCDVPYTLERSMYDAINLIAPDASFTIFTGDVVNHAIWNTSKASNTELIRHAYDTMNKSLNIVFATAGNHEAHPVNSFAPGTVNHGDDWIYDLLSDDWAKWIGAKSSSSLQHTGAYSTKLPHDNLRIISLNTNLYYRHNFWLFQDYDSKDPNGQILWLIKELDAAEKAKERVYLIGHMPFGEADALRGGSNYLDQVVNRYSDTIAAMFFGHTHVDHFEISYADYDSRSASNALVTSYIAPSLTPTSGMPSFRVYLVDPETFAVLDHTTYVADMTNPAFQTSPVWTKLYSAKEAYGSAVSPPLTDPKAELTPSFWHNVTVAFEKDDALFNSYMARKSRGWQPASCAGSCKTDEICQLRAGRSENNCWKPSPGVHLTRRSGVQSQRGEHDECGLPIILKTLGSVGADADVLRQLKMGIKGVIAEASMAAA